MFNLFEVWSCTHNYKIFHSHAESFKMMLYDGVLYAPSFTSKTDFNTNNGNYLTTPPEWLEL